MQTYGRLLAYIYSRANKMLLYYFRLILKGRKLRPIQGDPNQLGGDVIIDHQGIVRFAYPSEDPADRPSVEELLVSLRFLEKST